MELNPGGLIAWILVGLIAGGAAAAVTRTRTGCVSGCALGLVGAFIGGFLFSLIGIRGDAGFLGSVFVAFVGAVIALGVGRLLFG